MEQAQLHLPPVEVLKQLNLGFVHIFLNASIACILYTRRLVHWQSACFLSRTESQLTLPQSLQYVEIASNIHERFCSAEWNHDPDDSTSQAFKVMRRGGHRCADQILEMLSSGVMDSLQRDHLSVMKLFILAREKQDNGLVESYTFIFQTVAGSPSVAIAETDQIFYVDKLRSSFRKSITVLLRSIRDLPSLPRHGRRLGVSLLYKQTCPAPYQPRGFVVSTYDRPALWENGEDALQTTKFDTGAVIVRIGIQRHEEKSDADHRVGAYLNTLQQTSSRDAHLPPTLNQAESSGKRKRSVADVGGQTSRSAIHRPPSRRPAASDITISETTGAAGELPELTRTAFRQEQLKISDSKALVQFSSQDTSSIASSDINGEEFWRRWRSQGKQATYL